jgi:hypothetical protein
LPVVNHLKVKIAFLKLKGINKMNYKKPKGKIAILTVFFLILSTFPETMLVSANPSGSIYAYKQGTTSSSWSYPDGSYTINSTTFKIDLCIDGASNVCGWGVTTLSWNSSVVRYVSTTEGSYLNSGGTTMFFKGSADQVNGIIGNGLSAVIQRDSGSIQYAPASSGVLCTVTFKIVGVGDANITFNGGLLNDGVTPINTAISQPSITVLGPSVDGAIDVFTDKGGAGLGVSSGAYGPQNLVQIFARVSHPTLSVDNIDVLFTIYCNGTINSLKTAKTNSTGYALASFQLPSYNVTSQGMFGNWTISASASVSQTVISDSVGFVLSFINSISGIQVSQTVHKLENVTLTVPLSGVGNSIVWSELDITIFDQAQIPIASFKIQNGQVAQNGTVTASMFIPGWSFTGQATAYICILSSDGVGLIPESTVSFQILPPVQVSSNPFVAPEFALGALIAFCACFVAFVTFNSVKKQKFSFKI